MLRAAEDEGYSSSVKKYLGSKRDQFVKHHENITTKAITMACVCSKDT